MRNRRQIEGGFLGLGAWTRGRHGRAANCRADGVPFEIALALQQHLLFGGEVDQKLGQPRAIDADPFLAVVPLLLPPFLQD